MQAVTCYHNLTAVAWPGQKDLFRCGFVTLQMQVALWKSCLNPVQSASLMVRSYPRYPDVLAIMNAVAEAGGAPSAAALMAGADAASPPPARFFLPAHTAGARLMTCCHPGHEGSVRHCITACF